jgi:hypothetical protein
MKKYEAILISTQYYSVEVEADSEDEAINKAEEYLKDLGTAVQAYDGDTYVDIVQEIK